MKKELKEIRLCSNVAKNIKCEYGDNCKYSHDIKLWFEKKPKDISSSCYMYERYGKCSFGLSCRFSQNHIKIDENGEIKNLTNDSIFGKDKNKPQLIYNVLNDDLKRKLWKRNYNFKRSNQINDTVHKYVTENGLLKFNRNNGLYSLLS